MPRRVLVVVPCLNEREALPALVAGVRALAQRSPDRFELLVVDDGSSDDTAATAQALGVRVVRLCSNLGIGGAVQTGLRVAAAEGFDCAVQLDGDGQHPADELPALLAPLDRPAPPDLVIGSRFLKREGFQSTPARRLGIRWLVLALRLFTRLSVSDPTSGFRAYGPRALRLFDWRYPYDYPEPEALVLAHRASLAVAEVPVTMRPRETGASSIGGLAGPYYLLKVTLAILLDVVRSTGGRLHPPAPPARPLLQPPESRWSPSSAATGSSPPSAAPSPSSSSASSPGSA